MIGVMDKRRELREFEKDLFSVEEVFERYD